MPEFLPLQFGRNSGIMYLGVIKVDDYKEMYTLLFNKITDIICELKTVQLQAEELYLLQEKEDKPTPILIKKTDMQPPYRG